MSKQKTTVIATDTTTITQVDAKDSASIIARVDSIIIEEYNTDEQENITQSIGQSKPTTKCSCKKRNDTSQKQTGSLKKKTKIYGANLSSTWLSKNDSIKKKMTHQENTNRQIKQKTPLLNNVASRIIFAIIIFVITILAGYLIWKFAVQ